MKAVLVFIDGTICDTRHRHHLIGTPEFYKRYDFIMRCWTKEELHSNLTNAGFGSIVYFGDYDRNIPMGWTDRIVAVASLKR